MYTVIADNKEHKIPHDELHWFCFGLKCEDKEFTVIYPSGYIGEFKPIRETKYKQKRK